MFYVFSKPWTTPLIQSFLRPLPPTPNPHDTTFGKIVCETWKNTEISPLENCNFSFFAGNMSMWEICEKMKEYVGSMEEYMENMWKIWPNMWEYEGICRKCEEI